MRYDKVEWYCHTVLDNRQKKSDISLPLQSLLLSPFSERVIGSPRTHDKICYTSTVIVWHTLPLPHLWLVLTGLHFLVPLDLVAISNRLTTQPCENLQDDSTRDAERRTHQTLATAVLDSREKPLHALKRCFKCLSVDTLSDMEVEFESRNMHREQVSHISEDSEEEEDDEDTIDYTEEENTKAAESNSESTLHQRRMTATRIMNDQYRNVSASLDQLLPAIESGENLQKSKMELYRTVMHALEILFRIQSVPQLATGPQASESLKERSPKIAALKKTAEGVRLSLSQMSRSDFKIALQVCRDFLKQHIDTVTQQTSPDGAVKLTQALLKPMIAQQKQAVNNPQLQSKNRVYKHNTFSHYNDTRMAASAVQAMPEAQTSTASTEPVLYETDSVEYETDREDWASLHQSSSSLTASDDTEFHSVEDIELTYRSLGISTPTTPDGSSERLVSTDFQCNKQVVLPLVETGCKPKGVSTVSKSTESSGLHFFDQISRQWIPKVPQQHINERKRKACRLDNSNKMGSKNRSAVQSSHYRTDNVSKDLSSEAGPSGILRTAENFPELYGMQDLNNYSQHTALRIKSNDMQIEDMAKIRSEQEHELEDVMIQIAIAESLGGPSVIIEAQRRALLEIKGKTIANSSGGHQLSPDFVFADMSSSLPWFRLSRLSI